MTRPDHASSDDSCQKRFLWAHKEVDLVPHPVDGLVLQVGNALKFFQALAAIEEDGSDKRLVRLELACKADDVARQIIFSLAIAVSAGKILMLIFFFFFFF